MYEINHYLKLNFLSVLLMFLGFDVWDFNLL